MIVEGTFINPGKAKNNIERAAEMFAVHGDFLLRIFKKELNEQDAHDLWQNLFLSLTTKPVSVNISNVRGYLYRAAVHDIVDFKRNLKLHRRKIDEYSEVARQRKSDRSPVQQLISIESVNEAFRQIKNNLPPSVGQVVLNKYRKQLSHREIAEKMNIKKTTVDRYLSVGTKMMGQVHDQAEGDKHEHV